MTSKPYPISVVVTRDEVPEGGLAVGIDATADERVAIARYLECPSVLSMSARLTVTHWRGRGLAVRGALDACIVQTCVVTLEPFENAVHEDVESFFAPDVAPRPEEEAAEAAEIHDIDVEPLVHDRIDVGALVSEYLALGLDPYPRKPGVTFQNEAGNGEEEAKSGAFASLAALRGKHDET
ncbi:YceD family protein [Microbaculum sp. FT89]|uniref:YceD family protein n=1 Tax=Microbaculum sp. FT89 TaxID=3447298 RepID=UPI003F53B11E